MKVLILANFGMGLYNFRKELLIELIKQNHEVYISLPNDEYVDLLEELGCNFIDTRLERRGINPIADFKLMLKYIKLMINIKPDIVLTYTIKPNVYGGIACSLTKTPYITNITGLGTSIENTGLIQKISLLLYKISLIKTKKVFFQNEANRELFKSKKILGSRKSTLIPGSGVNLEQYYYEEYPAEDEQIRILFIGRIMKAKGIEELLRAAEEISKEYHNVKFDLVGGSEENYNEQMEELVRKNVIIYHDQQINVQRFIKNSHATILPSYHEGLANVLLESASMGRPIIASNIPGCKETFDEGISGVGFEAKNVDSLVEAIEKFINLPYEQKRAMGIAGRRKMEKQFDRELVINAYIDEIEK